jgi:large subunit ribosomal protein L25
VVYGPKVDPVPVVVDAHDLQTVLHTEAGANAIIHLEIEDGETVTTMARAIEKHPFRNEYRHVDFVTVDLTKTVHAEVAIHFEGTAAGVEEGGVFSPQRTSVRVEVLPTEIPSFIELDISAVEIGGSLRVEDLPEFEGLTYLEDPDSVVMSVTLPAAEIEEPEPEEELEGELAEGEEVPEGEEREEAEGDAEAAGGEEAEETED